LLTLPGSGFSTAAALPFVGFGRSFSQAAWATACSARTVRRKGAQKSSAAVAKPVIGGGA